MKHIRIFLALMLAFVLGVAPVATLAGCAPTNNYVAAFKGPEINVKTYGAVANDGADDAAAIQDAFDAAELTGGSVLFPPGVYDASGTSQPGDTAIAIDGGSNITVTGYGATIRQGTSTARVLGVFDSSNVHIKGLKIIGYTATLDPSAENHALIAISNSSNVTIADCYLTNSLGDCIYVGGDITDGSSLGYTSKNISITRNILKTRYGNGVASSSSGSMSRMAVAATDCDGLSVTDNTIYGKIDFEPNANYQGVRFALVQGNRCLAGPVRPQAVIGSDYWHDEPVTDPSGLASPAAAPTLATATTGGTIPAGTYYACITYYLGSNETVRSPESASITTTGSASTITVTGGAIPAGATGVKVYLTPATASPGAEVYAASYTAGTSVVVTALPSASAAWPPTGLVGNIALTGVAGISDTDRNAVQNNYIDLGSISIGNVYKADVRHNTIGEGTIIVGDSAGAGTSDAHVIGNRILKVPSSANAAFYVEETSTSVFDANEVLSGASKYMFELTANLGRNVYSNNRFMDLSGTGLFTGSLAASDVALANTKVTSGSHSPPNSTSQKGEAWLHNVAEVTLTTTNETVDWNTIRADFWNLGGNGQSLGRVQNAPDGMLLTIRSSAFGGGTVTVEHDASYIRMVDGADWVSSTGGESITFHAYSGILWEVTRSAAYPTTYLPVAKGGTGAATLLGAGIPQLGVANTFVADGTFSDQLGVGAAPDAGAQAHITHDSATNDAFKATNTNATYPRSWVFGPNTGTANTFGFRDSTGSTNVLALERSVDGGDVHVQTGDLIVDTVGKGVRLKTGSNATMGRAVLVGGTLVVSTTKATATANIILTTQVPGGTTGTPVVASRVNDTSFTIESRDGAGALQTSDTSTIAWVIFEEAP